MKVIILLFLCFSAVSAGIYLNFFCLLFQNYCDFVLKVMNNNLQFFMCSGQSDNFLRRFKNYLSDVWDDVAKIAEGAAIVVKFIDR